MNEISNQTLAIIPIDEVSCKILDVKSNKIIGKCVKKIINDNCCYYGSSYEGRLAGTKKILGVNYKAPIIIEESDDIVFFPTTSPRIMKCIWLSLKNIKDYKKIGKTTHITFVNDDVLDLEMSYTSFDNQVLRAARLQMLIKSRKIKQN